MTSPLQPVDILGDVFSTSSNLQGERIVVRLVGCLDMQTAPFLKRFLDQLGEPAPSDGVRELEFNTEQLYLMSSSAISCLASWLKVLKAGERVRSVKFVTNPNLGWQRRSLDPLRRLATTLVSIE